MYADELLDLRRDRETAELAGSVARRLELLLGTDNLYTQLAWQLYGSAVCNNGEVDRGLETLRRVEATWRRALPAGDRLIQAARVSVGECLSRAHRYAEAETTLLVRGGGTRDRTRAALPPYATGLPRARRSVRRNRPAGRRCELERQAHPSASCAIRVCFTW
jgi:hypothetical protein